MRLQILGEHHRDNGGRLFVRVRCRTCGTERVARLSNAKRDGQGECRCSVIGNSHGGSGTPEHRAWLDMRNRCNNPNIEDYPNYGGRGISVCAQWQDDFGAFSVSMGYRPKGHQLDRIDNEGDYTPSNCRWADWSTQQSNRRDSIIWTVYGVEYRAARMAGDLYGVSASCVRDRCKRGMPGYSWRRVYEVVAEPGDRFDYDFLN